MTPDDQDEHALHGLDSDRQTRPQALRDRLDHQHGGQSIGTTAARLLDSRDDARKVLELNCEQVAKVVARGQAVVGLERLRPIAAVGMSAVPASEIGD